MKQPKMELDIAVLTAGRVDLFTRCIESILPQMKANYSLTVMNNGANSAEYNEVYKAMPRVNIKRSNVNLGFAAGANQAMRAGTAPLIMFISDDIFLHDGAIEALLLRMKDQSIGICGMKLLFPTDSEDKARPAGMVQHIGMASDIRGNMTHPLIGWSPDNPRCCKSTEVLAVTGAAFMIRRDIYNKVRGFDTVYGKGYYEDMDMCFAIRANGKRVFIDTDAVATHGVAQTFKMGTGAPPNFQQNQAIFQSRWRSQTPWSEFTMW